MTAKRSSEPILYPAAVKPSDDTPHAPGNYAILTALSPNMWDDFMAFYDSIQRQGDYRIYAVALDLNADQRASLAKIYNVTLIEPDEETVAQYRTFDNHWRQWYKPAYMKYVAHQDYVLWLDVDMVILKDLSPLFAKATRQFFVIHDYFAPKTCINDKELYEEFPAPVKPEEENIALNSGVIGFSPKRDAHILEMWLSKVKILHERKDLRPYVKLYDQGALLWTLRELKMMDHILPIKEWNHPAKKNPYEYCLPNVNHKQGDHVWPGRKEPQLGGDLIQQITLDNPGVTIAHFAGLPKLSHLCQVDNNHSIVYFHQKRGNRGTTRVFVTGLERCGTHTLAEIFRRSCKMECWVRHEHQPSLSYVAMLKSRKQDYRTPEFEQRLNLYARSDCGLVAEANHRLAYFVQDLNKHLEGRCKFIMMLRDPVELVRSRLLNFAMWPGYIHKFPGCYQFDFFKLKRTFGVGSPWQNIFRVHPTEFMDMEPVDLHLWEISYTLDVALSQLRTLSDYSWKIFWLEQLQQSALQLVHFVGDDLLSMLEVKKTMEVKYGERRPTQRPETVEWVNAVVEQNAVKIYKTMMDTLAKHGIRMPFRGV